MTKSELRQILVDKSNELGRVLNNVIVDKYTDVVWKRYSTLLEQDDPETIEKIRSDIFN